MHCPSNSEDLYHCQTCPHGIWWFHLSLHLTWLLGRSKLSKPPRIFLSVDMFCGLNVLLWTKSFTHFYSPINNFLGPKAYRTLFFFISMPDVFNVFMFYKMYVWNVQITNWFQKNKSSYMFFSSNIYFNKKVHLGFFESPQSANTTAVT